MISVGYMFEQYDKLIMLNLGFALKQVDKD